MKNNLALFSAKIAKANLKIKKVSPEILIVLGIGGVVVGTIMACKATLNLEEAVKTKKSQRFLIKNARETINKKEYSQKDYLKDLFINYSQTATIYTRLYWPSAVVTGASIACILGSHKILKTRNVGLMAAYKTLDNSYSKYRKKLIETLGEEKEYALFHGLTEEQVEVEETDENGKKKKVKKTVTKVDPNSNSIYSKFFDSSCEYWSETPEYNYIFLKTQQNFANDKLHAQGHLFLNEVYDMLDIPRTKAGAVVGWVVSKDGDNFVDFGLFDVDNDATRRFINGLEDVILLDFNVDGVIFDLI